MQLFRIYRLLIYLFLNIQSYLNSLLTVFLSEYPALLIFRIRTKNRKVFKYSFIFRLLSSSSGLKINFWILNSSVQTRVCRFVCVCARACVCVSVRVRASICVYVLLCTERVSYETKRWFSRNFLLMVFHSYTITEYNIENNKTGKFDLNWHVKLTHIVFTNISK